jgi:hypothetical protein
MRRRARFAIASLFVIGCALGCALGCGGSGFTLHPDGGAAGSSQAGAGGSAAGGKGGFTGFPGTGNTIGSGTGNATGTGGSSITGSAGSGVTGTAGAGVDAGPPMPTGSLVFQGNLAALINNGPPCTGEVGATGDRWCGFFTPLGGYPADLYVVNVSKAAAGTSITCGTTDVNCLHLTDSFTQDGSHLALFSGDTLVYYDGTATPFGWRPGMTAGRALAVADPTLMDVQFCRPSLKGSAVTCIRLLPMALQTDPTNLVLVDLLAGHVDDAATPPLAKVETVIGASSADTNVNHFEVDFPVPGTDTLAWSARSSRTGPEVLKMQTLGNDASRVTVASSVNTWRTSPDGARWYWLSAVNDTSGAGTLQWAPYPAGTTPTTILASSVQYDFPTPTSVVILDAQKNLRTIPDPVGAPGTATLLDTGAIGLISLSPLGHVAYAKATTSVNGITFASMFVKKSDGTGACTVTSATDGYPLAFFFTPDSGAASWIQRGASAYSARYTRLSDCTTMTADSGIVWTEPVGNRGVLFIDAYDNTTGTGVMSVLNVAAGNTLSTDPTTRVSGQVGFWAVTASAGSDIVVYTVNGGGNDDGVYVRGFGP